MEIIIMRSIRTTIYLLCFTVMMCGVVQAKTISGTVTYNSSSVEDGLMSVEDSTGEIVDTTYTNSSGNYSIDGLDSEVYTLYCFPGEDYITPDSRSVSLVSVSTSDQDYTLSQAGKISGTIYESDASTVLEGALVITVATGGGCAVSDENGSYTIGGLSSDTYTVSISSEDWIFDDEENTSVTVGSTTTLNPIADSQSASISGVVEITTGGTDVEGAIVTAVDGDGEMVATAVSDETGDYELVGLEAASYDIYAQYEDTTFEKKTNIQATINGTTGINFVAETGKITGNVEYNSSGLGGAEIGAFPVGSFNLLQFDNTPALTTSDGSGDYEISYLPNGDYHMFARKDGYVAIFTASDITVSGGGTTSGTDFTITSNNDGSISGTVTNADTDPITNGFVFMTKQGDDDFYFVEEFDGSGNYTFPSLSAGTYDVVTCTIDLDVDYVQEKIADIGVSAGQDVTGKDFSLIAETGSISGTVEDTSALEGVYVEAYSSTYGYIGGTTTDDQGEYKIELLGAATDYTVTAEKEGYETGELTSITVTQNQDTSDVDFELTEE